MHRQSEDRSALAADDVVPPMPALPGVPPGLEYLIQVDQMLIHQKRYSWLQYNSQYEILNTMGQKVYFAEEQREWCGPRLDVRITDNAGVKVIDLLLPNECCSYDMELQVCCPPLGGIIGYVAKNWEAFTSTFYILNPAKETVLKIVGPGWNVNGFSDVKFKVTTPDESHLVGQITRTWRGLSKEMFSSNDHFSIQFPLDLDVKVKAVLMAASLFIDYLYYDQRRRNSN
ncbi:phospholipid scramblase 2-like isoform X2 [Rhinatrema bivittatum]|uniref:phospholipid scramblase 2-like isoform X2 n=1 Tax=Rhinatrema bivittatum TaxID=194408 RepID=UPI00112C60A8|nr:phospholipid scramblase 2-like isoform X2 [Rhinatrema bivittatum]XP_029436873.1 phospholipid scramblase 2-like isoform X2 [Rhinatrema bivittatum]XP_029436874.1 phospholipid scramblase 2-like isoform X2 [Rhinatrema bivittatum]XP_029436875.1 phospholipid scramblase 2-like isoform X2 [Rhinatrema bivittatum]XP_029436876.1 phospholipid scramblase 2-like isoform X2 [Rhinatrema bivittatum]XP_029436877.1 phospholipid scramblase 2-like isoform X2 [Rhinatrema bivittatum]XP_029436878.1 phospholipid s